MSESRETGFVTRELLVEGVKRLVVARPPLSNALHSGESMARDGVRVLSRPAPGAVSSAA